MRTLQSIIEEADALVPNPFDITKKIIWLNSINKEFFEFVKIPDIHVFSTETGKPVYSIPAVIKARNVDQVKVGDSFYLGAQYENVNPGHNQWLIDDSAKTLQLIPAPAVNGLRVAVRYGKTWSTAFQGAILTAVPDAPEEYQDSYVYGLCERMAKAMNDITLANNYGADYRLRLVSAQQTYGSVSTTGGDAK